MTSPSTPLGHDLRGATTRSTASRLLEGAGHAALVAYRRVLVEAARRAWQHRARSFAMVVGGYLGILALTAAVGYLTQYLFDYFGVALADPQNTGELSQPRASLVRLILPMI